MPVPAPSLPIALNASVPSILAGLKPRLRQNIAGRDYFQFHNGQIKRQFGEGHSRIERACRRKARRICQRSNRVVQSSIYKPDLASLTRHLVLEQLQHPHK